MGEELNICLLLPLLVTLRSHGGRGRLVVCHFLSYEERSSMIGPLKLSPPPDFNRILVNQFLCIKEKDNDFHLLASCRLQLTHWILLPTTAYKTKFGC